MSSLRFRRSCGVLLLASLAAACGELRDLPTEPPDGGPPPDPAATFTRVQQEILTPSCALSGCHGPLGTQEGLLLNSANSYANLVGRPSVQISSVARVQPGSPDQSYLVRKIEGVNVVGDRMPQGGPYLTAEQVRLVRDWIRRGAPND